MTGSWERSPKKNRSSSPSSERHREDILGIILPIAFPRKKPIYTQIIQGARKDQNVNDGFSKNQGAGEGGGRGEREGKVFYGRSRYYAGGKEGSIQIKASQVVKNPSAHAGDAEDVGLIPGSGRPPGEGNGNSLQYSCLGNPMDRGAWWATFHGVTRVRHN